MTRRVAAWWAWSLWALAVACLALGAFLGIVSEPTQAGNFILVPALQAFLTVGALVASHRPENPIGWIFCSVGLLGAFHLLANGYAIFTFVARPDSLPGGVWMAWIASWAGKLSFVLLFMFTLLLFPDGRLPSPRWRPAAWLSAGWLALIVVAAMLMPGTMNGRYPFVRNPFGMQSAAGVLDFVQAVGNPSLIVVAGLPAAALLWRFRRAKQEARQQLKWVALASTLLLVWVAFEVFLLPFPQLQPINNLLLTAALISIPSAIGVAILRHRLYDIDLIIRRTLVYSLISALLAPAYFGSVVVLQSVFRALTGQTSQLAIVLSTLAIAAVFFPIRQRVQAFIDQRFYRRKYDATRTLAEFGASLRDDAGADLRQLTERLVAVVNETMQPAATSLWLKDMPEPTATGAFAGSGVEHG